MDDSSSKKTKASIPNWQNESATSANAATPASPISQDDDPSSEERTRSLEDATRFLADESIRNAPLDRKVAFLKKKGLQSEEIQKVLEAADDQSSASHTEEASELKTIHDSTTTSSSKEQAQQSLESSARLPSESNQTQQRRDIPPIITYPEFLVKPQKPPPLVTFQRLAYAAYAFVAVSTLTYGASKYLVEPMLENLTEARRELADTTLADLEKLNAKLETNVSHVPFHLSSKALKKKNAELLEADDAESIDSDPTELFHRDIATQTSPQRSRTSSFSSSSTNLGVFHRPKDITAQQASRLASLHTTLSSLRSSTSSAISSESLKDSMSDFQSLLDNLQISNNTYQSEFNSIYPSAVNDDRKKKKPAENSEVAKFKTEIRALKGALLGARQFPVPKATPGYIVGSGAGVR